ncbi:lysosomal acid phosphatase-like [Macrosteles quadrilineatus]|uniref:lysosomal acid phosphatase-like n=1 Tax=Macrosteles quadrilineatus TaxID=74068 RepID=UPI0023E25823|nr:lysosomal acid phosphatase-like [Macrosteles quadrilineatus]
MWGPSLIGIALLLTCVNSILTMGLPTFSSSKDNQVTSLRYVYAFFRHGIRAPLYEPYPSDENKQKFHHVFEKLGILTKAGKEEMYEVGKELSKIYGSLVQDYSEDKVRASSTEKTRTIMSALSVMAGLFPPKKPILKDLKWQPIPIWTDTREFDKVYFYNDPDFPQLALKECPRFGKMIQKGVDVIKAQDKDTSRAPIYKLLQLHTQRQDINSIDTAYEIFDILEFENLNGLRLPVWATKPRREFGKKRLYPDLMRPIMVDWFYKTQWLDRDKLMLLFYSGPLFNSIYNQFELKKAGKTEELFRYHNTHDDTILTLRWALGFDDPGFEVQAGDGMAFELHEENGVFTVQVVYYHSLQRNNRSAFREVLHLRDCPSPCTFDKFFEAYERWTPEKWERECHIPS